MARLARHRTNTATPWLTWTTNAALRTETERRFSRRRRASLHFGSGAKTWEAGTGTPVDGTGKETWGFDGNFHEKFQTDSGVLSSDTTLVMLTIGGNDARFEGWRRSRRRGRCGALPGGLRSPS
jgi:hypothetical protein